MKIIFTHQWIPDFGWENTIYLPEDFESVEELGFNDKDGHVFIAVNKSKKQILKGYYGK